MRFIVKLAIGSVLIVLVLLTVNRLWVRTSAQPGGLPSIELIREKAELVTLEIHGSCIATAELSGFTGGVSCVVIVSGSIQLGSDLSHARYEQVDRDQKTAVLVLPEPVVLNHRVDLDRTRTYDVSRSGLWIGLPFGVREEEVIAAAYLRGEKSLAGQLATPEAISRARARTQGVIGQLIEPTGWGIRIQWQEKIESH